MFTTACPEISISALPCAEHILDSGRHLLVHPTPSNFLGMVPGSRTKRQWPQVSAVEEFSLHSDTTKAVEPSTPDPMLDHVGSASPFSPLPSTTPQMSHAASRNDEIPATSAWRFVARLWSVGF